MKIASHDIARTPFVILEIGVNHEGDFALAKRMIDLAGTTGAHAVKFQTYYVSRNRYLSNAIDSGRYRCTMGYEFSKEQFYELARLCEEKKLIFLSTPFDLESVDMLDPLCPVFKIASGDLTFYPLLEHVARKGKPILLSTGMGSEEEIRRAVNTIAACAPKPVHDMLVLLHCVSAYPCPHAQAHLRTLEWLREEFSMPVGYSDHTLGIEAVCVAVSLGAQVIEKHFTYRKEDQSFRDHALSADPGDVAVLMQRIHTIMTLRGHVQKERADIEKDNAVAMRRSLAMDRDLRKGAVLRQEDVTFLRPACGIATDQLAAVIGRAVTRDLHKGDVLLYEHLEGGER